MNIHTRMWKEEINGLHYGARAFRPFVLPLLRRRLLKTKGDLAAAEPLYREALEGRRETLGDRHPNTLTSIHNLGHLLHVKGDLAAAEPLYREALEVQRETLGNRHPSTRRSIKNLSRLLQAKDKLRLRKVVWDLWPSPPPSSTTPKLYYP